MTERNIAISVDVSKEFPDTFRIVTECDDELTEVVIMNASKIMDKPDEAALEGEFGSQLVEDHIAQCASCQAWEADK